MGCWVSTNNATSPPPPKAPHINSNSTKQNCISKSPPPTHDPLLQEEEEEEEETVKQVLSSETPTIFKHTSSPAISRTLHPKTAQEKNGAFVLRKPPFWVFGNNVNDDEVDSDICSTHTHSLISKTLTDKTENNQRRFKNRSFSGEVKSEDTVGRSPVRISEQSPNRNRPGSGRGRRRRRDSGESSGRRSRSPVIRSESSGSLKTGPHGSKSSGERVRKVGEDKAWPPTGNELLENQLVSLECFIFL